MCKVRVSLSIFWVLDRSSMSKISLPPVRDLPSLLPSDKDGGGKGEVDKIEETDEGRREEGTTIARCPGGDITAEFSGPRGKDGILVFTFHIPIFFKVAPKK